MKNNTAYMVNDTAYTENNTIDTNRYTFKDFLLSTGGKIGMIAVFYVVIWGIMLAFINTNSSLLMFAYTAIFTYFGWKALNRITPNIFLWMPLMGWVIYFLIKFVLSIIIGMFVAPFQIAKMITSTVQKNLA